MIASLQAVTKFYGMEESQPQKVLVGVDLTILPGESISIVGSSGGGKSTLLNILGTLDQPTTGLVELFGQSVKGRTEGELARVRASKIGFIFQLHHLLPQLTALENVLVPTLAMKKTERAGAPERARKLLERVGLASHAGKRPAQLSGGERQRVAVVRALINQPELLLADEPTGSLDEDNARQLVELLMELNEELGMALVMVTHDAALAGKMSRMLRLRNGVLEDVMS